MLTRLATSACISLNIQCTDRACLFPALTGRDGAYFFPTLHHHHHHHPSLFLRRWCSAQAHLIFSSRLRLKVSFLAVSLSAVSDAELRQSEKHCLKQSCQCRRLILLFALPLSSSCARWGTAGDGSPCWSLLHGLALDGSSLSRCISEALTGKPCLWNGKAVRPSAGNFPCPSLKRPGPRHSRQHTCK